jgi:hypothetical protein
LIHWSEVDICFERLRHELNEHEAYCAADGESNAHECCHHR